MNVRSYIKDMKKKVDNRKRIAVDMDGTLTKQALFPDVWDLTPKEHNRLLDKAKPDKELINIVNKYYDKGYIVYIYTARPDLYERATKKWLDKHGVKYHYIAMNKLYYDIFIDDKCIRPEEVKLWNKI